MKHALIGHRLVTPRRRRGARRIAAVALAAGALLAGTGGVANAADPYAPPDTVDAPPGGVPAGGIWQCRDGYQVNWIDPATGQGFTADGRGQARCITTMAHGGRLIWFFPEVTADWSIGTIYDYSNPDFPILTGDVTVELVIQGLPDGTYPVTLLVNDQLYGTYEAVSRVSAGELHSIVPLGTFSDGGETEVRLTAIVDDQTFTTVL